MNSYFFRVEHDLLRSEAFKTLGGSAIKVYLVVGLYSDFGTDWAYPSIRTIAREAGLSRQTVLAAIESLTRLGLLATSKAKGRSTAYKIIRQAPQRPSRSKTSPADQQAESLTGTGPRLLEVHPGSVLESLEVAPRSGPKPGPVARPDLRPGRPRGQAQSRTNIERRPDSIDPDSGNTVPTDRRGASSCCCGSARTPDQSGNSRSVGSELVAQKDPEAVAKVLLNALYLQSQGKLQNGPGYIRAGIEDGYDLLPQVASRLENRRRQLKDQLRKLEARQQQSREVDEQAAEQAAMAYMIEQLTPTSSTGWWSRRFDNFPSRWSGRSHPHQPLRPRQSLRIGLRRAESIESAP